MGAMPVPVAMNMLSRSGLRKHEVAVRAMEADRVADLHIAKVVREKSVFDAIEADIEEAARGRRRRSNRRG